MTNALSTWRWASTKAGTTSRPAAGISSPTASTAWGTIARMTPAATSTSWRPGRPGSAAWRMVSPPGGAASAMTSLTRTVPWTARPAFSTWRFSA